MIWTAVYEQFRLRLALELILQIERHLRLLHFLLAANKSRDHRTVCQSLNFSKISLIFVDFLNYEQAPCLVGHRHVPIHAAGYVQAFVQLNRFFLHLRYLIFHRFEAEAPGSQELFSAFVLHAIHQIEFKFV
jgi:hypothetical protein